MKTKYNFHPIVIFVVFLQFGLCYHVAAQEVPDTTTRELTKSLKPADVAEIAFYGYSFGCWEEDPIRLSDPSLIAAFVHALQHATGRDAPVTDHFDELEIHFKRQGTTEHPSLHLDFLAGMQLDSFGAEFRHCLYLLSAFQVKRLHAIAHLSLDQVISVRIRKESPIESTQELKRLWAALLQTHEPAFDYTSDMLDALPLVVRLVGGSTITLALVFRADRGAIGHQQDLPLPPYLWDHYLNTLPGRKNDNRP